MLEFLLVKKPGAFSISANERDHEGSVIETLQEIFFRKSSEDIKLIRTVFEKADTYNEALQMLVDTEIEASIYYILGGVNPGEGAVITRDY